jgi:2,3,4,5-tetrahydropyridine-2,6-dicarboxylate N-succinyltransferase
MTDINHLIEEIDLAYENNILSIELSVMILEMLSKGKIKVFDGKQVNHWVKKGILIALRSLPKMYITDGLFGYDKIPLLSLSESECKEMNVRRVQGSIVRKGAYVSSGCVLMPSFINVGAYVGESTMIDTWATVGSCAYIGSKCHISGGVGIGGVLEPIQANPVIIEDNCFIGARSEIVEGVRVESGSVIGMGVFISSSTRIINRKTGDVMFGIVPKNSVVVAGSYKSNENLNINCAVIIKEVDEQTRSKTSINELLRD